MASRETENSTYANFGVTNLTKSIMICYGIFWSGQFKRPRIKVNNSKVHVARSLIPGLVSVAWLSLRSRRLEVVVGTRKNRRARRRHACLPCTRPFSGSTTSKRLLRRLSLAMLTGRRLALMARYAQNIRHPRGGEEGIKMQSFVTVRKIAKVCLLHFNKTFDRKIGRHPDGQP